MKNAIRLPLNIDAEEEEQGYLYRAFPDRKFVTVDKLVCPVCGEPILSAIDENGRRLIMLSGPELGKGICHSCGVEYMVTRKQAAIYNENENCLPH